MIGSYGESGGMKSGGIQNSQRQRYVMLDAVRGLAVLLMIIFHVAYDLNTFGFAKIDIFNDPFWYGLPRFVVSLFLICVGMGLALVHGHEIKWKSVKKRFVKIGGWALAISMITYALFPKYFVYFGALHCIAVTSVAGVFFVNRPKIALLLGLIFVFSNLLFQPTLIPLSERLGVTPLDYVPFYPWFGMVLFGIYLKSIHFHTIPIKDPFPIKLLEIMGKHSLKIYLLHRPVLFGTFLLLYKLKTAT